MAKRDPALWKWTGKRFKYIGDTNLFDRRYTVFVSPHLLVEFELNRAGIARLAMGDELRDACRSVVNRRAMPFAERISPVDTGEYRTSWEADDTEEMIAGMNRVACRLVNTAPHAAAVEWVSRRGFGHGYRILGQTLEHLNLTSGVRPRVGTRARKTAGGSWNPNQHPRGPGGRFIPRTSTAEQTKRRAARAARLRDDNP